MSDRAWMSLDERVRSLRECLDQAREPAARLAIETELAWCHLERGELGAAFAVLWESDSADRSVAPERRRTRAELQAFCGNEDAALALVSASGDHAASAEMVRARIAASRGEWAAARELAGATLGSSPSGIRARLLTARAWLEHERGPEALSLLASIEPSDAAVALEIEGLRARCAGQDVAADLARTASRAKEQGAVRVQAETWTDLALWHRQRNEPELMRAAALRAVEIWDDMVTSLAPPLRTGFWNDRRRDAVRMASRAPHRRVASTPPAGLDALLANLRRLTSERDPVELLGVITEGAVVLSGAERGFVLLVNEDGTLEARTSKGAEAHLGVQTAAFSRSIAETVLIDGEPVVTVDAAEDPRVQDYMSVHRLMLRSVACLPIASHGRTWGVLYLDHRSTSGRFSGVDLDVLRAYADQAAIAIETSRLFDEVHSQKRELEEANRALQDANAQLEQRLRGQAETLRATMRRIEQLQMPPAPGERWGLVGASDAMRQVFALIERVAAAEVPVVIVGESGTGKELVARAIHAASPRSEGPYVSVSCGAVPETLLESELFGHVAGAFTGAARNRDGVFVEAHGGTLFLDEVVDMPAKMQLDLLRVLQEKRVRPVGASEERSVDVRLVTASRRPLRDLTANGGLREDLYYRLAVVELTLPPLRERRSDIPLLCDHFLSRIAKERGERKKRLGADALHRLQAHDFPGNVRELEHLLVNASVFAGSDTIGASDLSIELDRRTPTPLDDTSTYEDYKNEERDRIVAALNAHRWNRARAARALGMPRRTFYRRLKEHGIELPKRGR